MTSEYQAVDVEEIERRTPDEMRAEVVEVAPDSFTVRYRRLPGVAVPEPTRPPRVAGLFVLALVLLVVAGGFYVVTGGALWKALGITASIGVAAAGFGLIYRVARIFLGE